MSCLPAFGHDEPRAGNGSSLATQINGGRQSAPAVLELHRRLKHQQHIIELLRRNMDTQFAESQQVLLTVIESNALRYRQMQAQIADVAKQTDALHRRTIPGHNWRTLDMAAETHKTLQQRPKPGSSGAHGALLQPAV